MGHYAFVVAIPNGDEQEYRVEGPSLGPEEAVRRCYQKYPDGRITRVLNGDMDTPEGEPPLNLTNPNLDLLPEEEPEEEPEEAPTEDGAENAEEDGDSTEGVTPPFDPADFTLAELEDEVRGHTDEALAAVLDAEMEGKDRTGATDLIHDEMTGYQP